MEVIVLRGDKPVAYVALDDWYTAWSESQLQAVLVEHGVLPADIDWRDAICESEYDGRQVTVTQYYHDIPYPYPATQYTCRVIGEIRDSSVVVADTVDTMTVCADCGTPWQDWDLEDTILDGRCPQCTANWLLDYHPDTDMMQYLLRHYADSLSAANQDALMQAIAA